MIAYTVTSSNKVWLIDEANGDTIPRWCYDKEGYHVVEKLPDDIQAIIDNEKLIKVKEDKIEEFSRVIQNHLDSKARELRYDNMMSARSYAGYENPYQTEAQKLSLWCSDCWAKAGEIEADVLAGNREMPTIDELIAELPLYEE